MKYLDIVVMGKTGVGKSTLINSILKEDLAPTGIGMPITRENKTYSKQITLNYEYLHLNLYDTVGLEIDNGITNQTLRDTKRHIEESRKNASNSNMHVVFFCVNNESKRFEPFEIDLIRKLSIEYEIPFVIVITQCYSNNKGELEKQIEKELPEVLTRRILAKDYSIMGYTASAYGVSELLSSVIDNYQKLKVKILENKIKLLDDKYQERIKDIQRQCNRIIDKKAKLSIGGGFIPGVNIVAITKLVIDMISEMNDIAGINLSNDFINDLMPTFKDLFFPSLFLLVPGINSYVADKICKDIGYAYKKMLMNVIESSNDSELRDTERVKKRIKEELARIKK